MWYSQIRSQQDAYLPIQVVRSLNARKNQVVGPFANGCRQSARGCMAIMLLFKIANNFDQVVSAPGDACVKHFIYIAACQRQRCYSATMQLFELERLFQRTFIPLVHLVL